MMRRLLLAGLAAWLVFGPALGRPAAQEPNPNPLQPPNRKLEFSLGLPGAAAKDDAVEVTKLLHSGSNPNDADGQGNTALIYAAMHGNAEIAKLLIGRGAAVETRDRIGNTALHLAAQRGSVDVMTLLIAAKAAVDLPNKEGVTPLMLAAGGGQVAAVRLLMSLGADASRQDFTGRDAPGWASGKPAVLQVLRNAKHG
ncbi:MAG: ankyrin repeat domain-containing protein [Stellaceae bacterium]